MTYRIERRKWILYRHTNNLDIISAVAANLKKYSKCSISKDDRKNLLKRLKELEYYKGRNPNLPLDAINHRINTLAYYMFGYKYKIGDDNKFLFSPLGNLFLKHLGDSEKTSKIFFTMLWSLQFEHPHGGSDEVFRLYPFRLIFKLLTDKRIGERLSVAEVAYHVVFTEKADEKSYEALVKNILETRNWTNQEMERRFKEDEHVYVNAVYEWDYYVSKLLESAGIIERDEGEAVCTLIHGTGTKRTLRRTEVKLSSGIKEYCNRMLSEYPFDEEPLNLRDEERMIVDVVKEIYSFFPEALLDEIGEEINVFEVGLLELPKLIEEYSLRARRKHSYLFEDVLERGFNMFYNVKAKKISGPGNVDIECLYMTKKIKFAVEAKSTSNKLPSLNAGRLASHRSKIGGKYTIVITPSYVPAVRHDIESTEIVIITASTFSEYLYNNIINNVREIDYSDLDEIINNNLGTDVSRRISDLTIAKFGAGR